MDHNVVEIEANNNNKDDSRESKSRWERCSARVESLKNKTLFHLHDVLEEKEVLMSREMYEAVRDGNMDAFVDVLEALCERKQAPLSKELVCKITTPGGDTVLHVAAEFGRDNIAKLIASAFPEFDLTIRSNKGDTPLHVAARAKSLQVMKVILTQNVSNSSEEEDEKITRVTNKYGNTPLHEAVISKHFDGVSLLLSSDQDVAHTHSVVKFNTPSPLYMAVETGDLKILHLLLPIPFPSHGSPPTLSDNSPIHAAILFCKSAMLKEIVNMKPSLLDLRDVDGGTALHFAAHTGYVEGVRIILNRCPYEGFKFNHKKDSPIHIACKVGHLNVVKELLRQEWPHPKILLNKRGQNILHVAAKSGKNIVVKYLLRNPKIDTSMLNARDSKGNTPLHLASEKFCPWTLLALSRDKRLEVNSINKNGFTARDIVWFNSNIPKTRQQFLSEVILGSAGVPLRLNKLPIAKNRVPHLDWNVKDAAETLIIVGVLIVTLTFAAGFTIPGGVYGSDAQDPRKKGMAVLAHETLFNVFMVFNSIAMYSSTLGSAILIWVRIVDRRSAEGVYRLAKFFVYLALVTMPVAFLAATRLEVSNNRLLADFVTGIGLIFILFILFVRILARFPLGTRLPFFRHVGELFIMIILFLFYGRHDVVLNGKGKGKEDNLPHNNDNGLYNTKK